MEFNDQPWLPEVMRESVTEVLGRAIRWGRYLDGVAPVFQAFLQRAGSDRILDLCAGSGEPVCVLLGALAKAGHPLPDLMLCDLFPNVLAMERSASRFPGKVAWVSDPVDATCVPPELSRPIRTYVNCLHHFEPALVRNLFADCVRAGSSLFVIESFPRSFLRAAALAPSLLASAIANPFVAPRSRLAKAAITFGGPLVALGAFDILASACRIHTPEELTAIGQEVDGGAYEWSHGFAPFPFGGKAMWFSGVPRAA